MGRWGRLIVTGIAIVTLVVGAGAGVAAADDYGNAPVVTVRMTDNEFTPQTVVVDPGTVVRWVNAGRNKHNIIVDQTSIEWSSSKSIKPGGDYDHQFDSPGVFGYSCTFHGAPHTQMYGTVIVRNADGTVPAQVAQQAPEPHAGGGRTIRVPKDQKTIQTAVDKA